ncbi:MAG: ATP-binding protein [Candidatus Nanohaloarchaeota archaeon QJJ-5]|nr:ATP-binding protein [Candidatus Nanohaloarchaeota archaeon QJJ-5]
MYEKKLRELFKKNKKKAEAALDSGDKSLAASHYESCGDILMEQAKKKRGKAKEEKEKIAEKYYEISKNLNGESDSLDDEDDKRKVKTGDDDDEDFSDYVDRFVQESDTTWDDVAGMTETKRDIKESFALSAIDDKPAAVQGIHTILMYGPPGTGKTLLASAVAGSHNYPFFNVQLSHALSKYYGESGKIVSQIFQAAREKAPAIVFLDELDSIAMSRGQDLDEATRRVLSTLLTELSGFDAKNSDIMFMGATNAPWDLDPAVLSRVERVIYVPLPDVDTARKIIELNTIDDGIGLNVDPQIIAQECVKHNYSGREIKNIAKEAVREMVNDMNPELQELATKPVDDIKEYELKVRQLTEDDFYKAFDHIDPKTSERDLKRYKEWGEEFGS